MSALSIVLISLALHILAFCLFIRHCRAERHRAYTPIIGSDLKLTEALHKRLVNRQPCADWLNPAVMRDKIVAWLRTGGKAHE